MKTLELIKVAHSISIGDVCGPLKPNVIEDTIFVENGIAVGFYIKDISKYSERAAKLANVANAELLSERVPKSTMKRSSGLIGGSEKEVLQFSTILGSVPPKPHMRRPYPIRSSVHGVKSAETFVKAMLMLCNEGEEIIKNIAPDLYQKQKNIFDQHVPKKWRFGKLFTSSISNFNISAPFHRDAANIENCVNIIIAKKHKAEGGHTTVPDYGATVDSCDNSMLVYPAWRNVHGVTPIEPSADDGYRNSLVFYPLKAFYDIEN
jgi:hypothetical protein